MGKFSIVEVKEALSRAKLRLILDSEERGMLMRPKIRSVTDL